MRLAEHENRLTHWEELLDELDPRQVVVLMAYRQIHPWPEDLENKRWAIGTASICTAVSKSMSSNGKECDPNDLLKLLEKNPKVDVQTVSPNAAAAIFRTQYKTG